MGYTISHLKNGRLVTMEYKNDQILLDESEKRRYIDFVINRIYAILGVYEDCESDNNFDNYYRYTKRLIVEFIGAYKILKIEQFLSLISIITGMSESKNLNHSDVKSITFHCISILKKAG